MSNDSYHRRASDEEIGLGKPQLTQTVSNAYTISPELFEKVWLSYSPALCFLFRVGSQNVGEDAADGCRTP